MLRAKSRSTEDRGGLAMIRSIITIVVFLSMLRAASADSTQLFAGLLGIGLRVYESNQQLRAIDRLNRPIIERIRAQAEIQKQTARAQEAVMLLNANDRSQLVATLNAKLRTGNITSAELELVRVLRGMTAMNANHVGVGSLTIGRGAEFGGLYGGGYGAGGGYEDGELPYSSGGSYYGGGYAQARFNAQAAANDAAWAQQTSFNSPAAREAQARFNAQAQANDAAFAPRR